MTAGLLFLCRVVLNSSLRYMTNPCYWQRIPLFFVVMHAPVFFFNLLYYSTVHCTCDSVFCAQLFFSFSPVEVLCPWYYCTTATFLVVQ